MQKDKYATKDLAKFGTADYPLHPSGMRNLLMCPWKSVMRYLYAADEEGGQAGDTGSATHVAVAEFHRGKELADCLAAMGAGLPRYPRADLNDAADLFLKYAADPRNRDARVILIECPISFSIQAAPTDPTGAPIQVEGTLDQVRERDNEAELWDLKTSKKQGTDLLYQHVFQIASYCIGASIKLGRKVKPGGLILPRRYSTGGTGPAFWHFPWTFEDIEQILLPVRLQVAKIRAGQVYHMPHMDLCTYCSARSPDICLPMLQSLNAELAVKELAETDPE